MDRLTNLYKQSVIDELQSINDKYFNTHHGFSNTCNISSLLDSFFTLKHTNATIGIKMTENNKTNFIYRISYELMGFTNPNIIEEFIRGSINDYSSIDIHDNRVEYNKKKVVPFGLTYMGIEILVNGIGLKKNGVCSGNGVDIGNICYYTPYLDDEMKYCKIMIACCFLNQKPNLIIKTIAYLANRCTVNYLLKFIINIANSTADNIQLIDSLKQILRNDKSTARFKGMTRLRNGVNYISQLVRGTSSYGKRYDVAEGISDYKRKLSDYEQFVGIAGGSRTSKKRKHRRSAKKVSNKRNTRRTIR